MKGSKRQKRHKGHKGPWLRYRSRKGKGLSESASGQRCEESRQLFKRKARDSLLCPVLLARGGSPGPPDTCMSQTSVLQGNCIQSRVGDLVTSEGIRHGFQAEKDPGPVLDLLRARQVRAGRSFYFILYPTKQVRVRPLT